MPEHDGRTAVITMGTSMLSSASWRYEGTFRVEVPGYDGWLSEQLRAHPLGRAREGAKVQGKIEAILRRQPKVASTYFAWRPHEPLRYGAELTTLIRIAESEENDLEVADGLRRRYARVLVVCHADERDPATIAGTALAGILRDSLSLRGVELQAVLRGNLSELRAGFERFLRELAGTTDLVVSGGYKMLAMQAGFELARRRDPSWRVFYVHEDLHTDLVIHRYDDETGGVESEDRSRQPHLWEQA